MRLLHLLPAASTVLLLAACGGSTGTGTEIEPSLEAQPPPFEVTSEEPRDGGGAEIAVEVSEDVDQTQIRSMVAGLQDDRGDDGVYDLTITCTEDGSELATSTWATGDAALEETGLETGEIEVELVDGSACGQT